MIIDTHCHLVSSKYENMDKLVADSCDLGVTHCVTQGTHRADWLLQLELVARYPHFMSSCLAIHPCDAMTVVDGEGGDLELLRELCLSHPPVAIGETGLDYFWSAPEGWTEEVYRARQQNLLEAQFQLASDLGLNISIHTRDRKGTACFDDCVAIARNFPKVRPVFHCFIGTKQQAQLVFDELNGLISFTGIMTFKKTQDVQDVVSWCPEGRFMAETDSPYLSPEPFRGKVNIPGRTRYVVEKMAQLRRVSVEEIAAQTTATAREFFRFKNI